MASISDTAVTAPRFEGEVQQVVETYFFRSSKLSRAKLGSACLCYLKAYKCVNVNTFFSQYFIKSCRKKYHSPPRVVLRPWRRTAARRPSEGVSYRKFCFSVDCCDESLGNCPVWGMTARASDCSASSLHCFYHLEQKQIQGWWKKKSHRNVIQFQPTVVGLGDWFPV